MSQLDTLIIQIATALSITSIDVYVLFICILFSAVFLIVGIEKLYSVFFGIVLGIGIFVLLSTLLSPQYQTPETLSLISDTFAKIIIGSSVYLIFILAILVPMNGDLSISYPSSPPARFIQTLLIWVGLFFFFAAVILGLVERSYIFMGTESAFLLFKKMAFYSEFQSSHFAAFVISHLPSIVILGVGFIIYKLLFADIVYMLVLSVIASIKKRWGWGGGWHHDDGGYEEYEEHHGH